MKNEIKIIEPMDLTPEIVRQQLCPNATDKEIFMFLQIAASCKLNPFLNQIYLIKYSAEQKAQILTSYNVYLQRAEKSGQYGGLETKTEGSVKTGDLKAVVKVFRKDWIAPLIHEVYYDEYVQTTKDYKTGEVRPNKFWGEKPRTMIVKVAVSQAFRLAFPCDFEGLPYTQDEINTIEVDPEPTKTTVSMPKPKETKVLEAKTEEVKKTEEVSVPKKESVKMAKEAKIDVTGVISRKEKETAIALAVKNGYTQKEGLEIIGALGYLKFADILVQDLGTVVDQLAKPAVEWRAIKEEIIQEIWNGSKK